MRKCRHGGKFPLPYQERCGPPSLNPQNDAVFPCRHRLPWFPAIVYGIVFFELWLARIFRKKRVFGKWVSECSFGIPGSLSVLTSRFPLASGFTVAGSLSSSSGGVFVGVSVDDDDFDSETGKTGTKLSISSSNRSPHGDVRNGRHPAFHTKV